MRIILDQWRKNNMGVIAYLSYLFSLRLPSGSLQPTAASTNAKLLKFCPQGPKASIFHRTYQNATAMVIKFRFRKNIRGGFVLIRPCHCAMVSPPNRAFCPVHGICATNRGRLTPGNLLSPNASANNFNHQLKRAMRDLN